tara:strand:+ start:1150 stop:1389 length:240 start_codon:yes stop_codon:yes gene_type:complete
MSINKGDILLYTKTNEMVEVIDIHHDDIEPYFTIRIKDGSEKQTISKFLSKKYKKTRKRKIYKRRTMRNSKKLFKDNPL